MYCYELKGTIKTLSEQVEGRAAEAERNKRDAIEASSLSEPPEDVTEGKITVDDVNRELTQAESQVIH